MPTKQGNGGHGQENYDPETGRYVESGGASSGDFKNTNNTSSNFLEDFNKILNEPIRGLKLKPGFFVRNDNAQRIQDFESERQLAVNDQGFYLPFNKKVEPTTLLEDITNINPNHDSGWDYQNNCQRCVPTFVANHIWGYDVEANPSINEYNENYFEGINHWTMHDLYAIYENPKPTVIDLDKNQKESWALLDEEMNKCPDGAVFQVTRLGHTYCVIRQNGKNIAIEPQAPSYYKSVEDLERVNTKKRASDRITSFCRVDNLKPSREFWNVCHNRGERKNAEKRK